MHYIKALLHKFFAVRSTLGRIGRWATYLIAFFVGLSIIGPFIASPAYKLLRDQIAARPLLGYLLDPGDWIRDQIVGYVGIVFAVWTCAFAAYCKFKDRVDDLNIYVGYASSLARGIGTFLITLFVLIAGIGISPVLGLHKESVHIPIVSLAFVGFGMPGLFFSCAKVGFKRSSLLDNVAPHAVVVCGLLTAATIIYGATANLVGLARFLLKHG